MIANRKWLSVSCFTVVVVLGISHEVAACGSGAGLGSGATADILSNPPMKEIIDKAARVIKLDLRIALEVIIIEDALQSAFLRIGSFWNPTEVYNAYLDVKLAQEVYQRAVEDMTSLLQEFE